jgi:hypothetical protein
MATPRKPRSPRARPGIEPGVIVDVLFESGLLFLSLKNVTSRAAYNVSVRFEPPLMGFGGTVSMGALPLFRDLTFLAPGREIRTLLDSSAAYFVAEQPALVTATVTFADVAGRRKSATIRHNLEIYRRIAYAADASRSEEG